MSEIKKISPKDNKIRVSVLKVYFFSILIQFNLVNAYWTWKSMIIINSLRIVEVYGWLHWW